MSYGGWGFCGVFCGVSFPRVHSLKGIFFSLCLRHVQRTTFINSGYGWALDQWKRLVTVRTLFCGELSYCSLSVAVRWFFLVSFFLFPATEDALNEVKDIHGRKTGGGYPSD